ncbi:MAG: hypothetical protein IT305_06090 [Chloroflexi bacterium]|nr:hypothetical protein [Chloroflexota bacterium]
MAIQHRSIAVGVFDSEEDAKAALAELKDAAFDPATIGVVTLRRQDAERLSETTGAPGQVRDDQTTGLLAGGLLGGVAGWLIGAASVAVPGLGALVAAGALVGAVGGAGIGAAAGGILGFLIDQGLGHEEARYYQERVQAGSILVTVRDPRRADEARDILRRCGGSDFMTRRGADTSPPLP